MKLALNLLVWTLLVLLLAGPFAGAQTSNWEAFVGRVTGNWKFIGQRPTPCDAQSKKTDPAHPQFLDCFVLSQKSCAEGKDGTLVMLFGNEAYSYSCDRPANESCESIKEPPDKNEGFKCVRRIVPLENRGKISRFLAAVVPLFAESPAHYITPVSRGLEAELADSVVPLQGDRVDLASAFQEMGPGTYSVHLESLSNSARPIGLLQVKWSGGGPASIPASGMQGLYRLVRLTPSGEPAGLDAWVLVSGPDRFAKDSAAFQSAVEETRKWSDDVDARAPRAVLRAYLDSLSRQAQRER